MALNSYTFPFNVEEQCSIYEKSMADKGKMKRREEEVEEGRKGLIKLWW